jgi:hypothetical protein
MMSAEFVRECADYRTNLFLVVAPNNGTPYSFVKQWWKDVKSCFTNYALPTLESDLNPLTPGVMTPSDMASQLSQASPTSAAEGMTKLF